MIHPETIRPVTITRDRFGFWTHPHYFQPAGDEATPAEFGNWLHQHRLSCTTCSMADDASPVMNLAWEHGFTCISEWEPSPPSGSGWFIGSIHDTEDGPVCVWLREAQ